MRPDRPSLARRYINLYTLQIVQATHLVLNHQQLGTLVLGQRRQFELQPGILPLLHPLPLMRLRVKKISKTLGLFVHSHGAAIHSKQRFRLQLEVRYDTAARSATVLTL